MYAAPGQADGEEDRAQLPYERCRRAQTQPSSDTWRPLANRLTLELSGSESTCPSPEACPTPLARPLHGLRDSAGTGSLPSSSRLPNQGLALRDQMCPGPSDTERELQPLLASGPLTSGRETTTPFSSSFSFLQVSFFSNAPDEPSSLTFKSSHFPEHAPRPPALVCMCVRAHVRMRLCVHSLHGKCLLNTHVSQAPGQQLGRVPEQNRQSPGPVEPTPDACTVTATVSHKHVKDPLWCLRITDLRGLERVLTTPHNPLRFLQGRTQARFS